MLRCHVAFNRGTGVISEIESSVQQKYKKKLFPYKKLSKGTFDLSNPNVHSIFTLPLIKQIFGEKNH